MLNEKSRILNELLNEQSRVFVHHQWKQSFYGSERYCSVTCQYFEILVCYWQFLSDLVMHGMCKITMRHCEIFVSFMSQGAFICFSLWICIGFVRLFARIR
jgi:hypothetical protein